MISKRLFLLNKDIFFDFHALKQAVETLRRFSIQVDEQSAFASYRQVVKPKIGSVYFCSLRSPDNSVCRLQEADVGVYGWNDFEPIGPVCEFTKSLREKRWSFPGEEVLREYQEIFLLDTQDSIRANREALFSGCSASIREKVREVCFLDWRLIDPREKVPGSFEVFSDPALLALLGVEEAPNSGRKFAVDSTAVPSNLELQCWGTCVAFAK